MLSVYCFYLSDGAYALEWDEVVEFYMRGKTQKRKDAQEGKFSPLHISSFALHHACINSTPPEVTQQKDKKQ